MTDAADGYQGYVNRETWAFNLHWQNDYALYHATLDCARECLRRVPGMTDQTLGRNVKDTLRRWCTDGAATALGWQPRDYPEVNPATLAMMAREVGDFTAVNEYEVGEAVRESVSVEA